MTVSNLQEPLLRVFKSQILLLLLPLIAAIPLLPSHSQHPLVGVRSQSLLYPQQAGRQIDLTGLLPTNEVFWLNLEEGYFACQLNDSSKFLKLFHLSRLCDGHTDCYGGSDELEKELKCSQDCEPNCQNGVCMYSGPLSESQCHCHDGFGGKDCSVKDVNECKYSPCSIFATCTNTLGSFECNCRNGYEGDGFKCNKQNDASNEANDIGEAVLATVKENEENNTTGDVNAIISNIKHIVQTLDNQNDNEFGSNYPFPNDSKEEDNEIQGQPVEESTTTFRPRTTTTTTTSTTSRPPLPPFASITPGQQGNGRYQWE